MTIPGQGQPVGAVKQVSKRQALTYFQAAKSAERELFPFAGTQPEAYAAAKNITARAFEVYEEARVCSGITVTPERFAVITVDATALAEGN